MCYHNEPGYEHHREHHGDCGCGCRGEHAPREQWHHHGHSGYGLGRRRFPTREEIVGRLEEYLKQLQAEAKGVEERIAELSKAG